MFSIFSKKSKSVRVYNKMCFFMGSFYSKKAAFREKLYNTIVNSCKKASNMEYVNKMTWKYV